MGLIQPTYVNTEDMKAGKYLGLTPKPCTSLRVIPGDQKVTIYVTDASDTVIDSQKLVTVAGTKVVYKTGSAPAGPEDGTEVFTSTHGQYESEGYELTGLTNETTYYFAAFTVSDHGMVNMDNVSASVTPTEQEICTVDVVTSDALEQIAEDVVARLTLTDETTGTTQEAAINGGVGNATFNIPVGDTYHVSIKLSKASYSIVGGQVVASYEDIDYYQGTADIHIVLNKDSDSYTAVQGNVRTVTMTVQQAHLYGYDLVIDNSSPSGRVSYPATVNNKDFAPFSMNFSAGIPNYGGWSESQDDIFFMPKPCMLNPDGTVEYYLSISDYTKQEDGTTAADITDSAGTGKNAMMEWTKIWTKRYEDDNGVYHFLCSDVQIDDDFDCLCNYDINDNQIDHFYTAIYFGSNRSSKLRSVANGSNMVSQTGTTEITYAKANGAGWDIEVLADRLLIADLLVLMGKSTDTQGVYGYGNANASAAIGQGTMNARGLFYATSATANCSLKVFGMEFYWSNLWRRCEGLVTNASSQILYKLTAGRHDGTTADGYNTTGAGYKTAGPAAGTSGGYINKCKVTDGGRIPVTASGSSSTYECDGLWFAASCFALVGGNWDYALLEGAFCVNLNNAVSYTNARIGAVLSCKPLAA